MKPITNTSEQLSDYRESLTEADTLEKLRALVDDYDELAPDACQVAHVMNEEDFAEFRAGLLSERSGVFAGDWWQIRYADILMPLIMVKVFEVAHTLKIPWGCAYLQMQGKPFPQTTIFSLDPTWVARVTQSTTADDVSVIGPLPPKPDA